MKTISYISYKKEVARWMRRLYKRGLTTSLGGNISLRVNNELFVITSSETDKGKIKADEIALVNMSGDCLDKDLRVSMETQIHLNIYQKYEKVTAIVHAHPALSSAFAAMEMSVNTMLLAEAFTIIGDVVKAGYAMPGSIELAHNVSEAAGKGPVVLMENHGVLAAGESLLQAFDRIEVLENAARMTIIAHLMKDGKGLNSEQLKALKLHF